MRGNSALERSTALLLKLVLLMFLFVQPYANHIDPALIVLMGLIGLLAVPAGLSLFVAERSRLEVWLFLPMLLLSGCVGLLNDHLPSNVIRGVIPYAIYLIAFLSALVLSPPRRFALVPWIVAAACLLSLKTVGILATNGVGSAAILQGARATFYDINSGLPIGLAALPLVVLCVPSGWARLTAIAAITGQIVLGQSKALMGVAALVLAVLPFIGKSKLRNIEVGAYWRFAILAAGAFALVILIGTFQQNPLVHRFVVMIEKSENELGGRRNEMQNAWMSFERAPLLGEGQGFVFLHRPAGATDDTVGLESRRYLHSVFFYHLAIMGILGLPFALLLLHGPFLYAGGRLLRLALGRPSVAKRHQQSLLLPLVLSGLGLFLFNLVSASFKNPQTLILTGIVNALLWAAIRTPGACPAPVGEAAKFEPTLEGITQTAYRVPP